MGTPDRTGKSRDTHHRPGMADYGGPGVYVVNNVAGLRENGYRNDGGGQ